MTLAFQELASRAAPAPGAAPEAALARGDHERRPSRLRFEAGVRAAVATAVARHRAAQQAEVGPDGPTIGRSCGRPGGPIELRGLLSRWWSSGARVKSQAGPSSSRPDKHPLRRVSGPRLDM